MNRHTGRPVNPDKRVNKKGQVQVIAWIPKEDADWLFSQPKGLSEKFRELVRNAITAEQSVHSEEALVPLDERYGVCEMCGENAPAIKTPNGEEVPYCSLECAGRQMLHTLDNFANPKITVVPVWKDRR